MRRTISSILFALCIAGLAATATGGPAPAKGAAPGGGGGKVQSKFYDFSDQLIDGEIKKPTALYTDARQQVKFDRLLRLKKSFLPEMMQTSKENIFK